MYTIDANETHGRLMSFTTPTGYKYTIREQNGEDDDILSNLGDSANLFNISKFVAGLVVETDYTSSHKVTAQQVHTMPSLDRYCILIMSRIFSISKEMDFYVDWGNGRKVEYTQDLEELVFDYEKQPSEEDLLSRKDAIPYYPYGKQVKDITIQTTSGKSLLFDLMTPESEAYLVNLPIDQRTKNQELVARNLRLKVGDHFEKVQNFRAFSVKDMMEIRRAVSAADPIYGGDVEVEDPMTKEVRTVNLFSLGNFFYPEEI